MTDVFTPEKRSSIMRAVKTRNTAPECAVRAILRRLHVSHTSNSPRLPGKPDLVVAHLRMAIFVHGCLWHGHERCKRATLPVQNREFWAEKIAGNRRRDRRMASALRRMGYAVITVWGCQTGRVQWLERRILSVAAQRKVASKRAPSTKESNKESKPTPRGTSRV
jgi:DNA mismatch endonuclease (patch repair protein)